MFGFRRRRRERLRQRPFPESWLDIVERQTPYYHILPEERRRELLQHTRILLHEKHFEGCGGFTMTDEARVTIAAHAAILLVNRSTNEYFPGLKTILVYPDVFVVNEEQLGPDGTIREERDTRAGEAWDSGVIVLAWEEVEWSCRSLGDGYNVVLHEFAHQLDWEDGVADGAPLFPHDELAARWGRVLKESYEELTRDVRNKRRTLLDDYGATDPAEFFAVATETFFELPIRLRKKHARLYFTLKDYFRQDPASWLEDAGSRF